MVSVTAPFDPKAKFDRRSPVRAILFKDPKTNVSYDLGALNASLLVKSVEVIESDKSKDSAATIVLHDPNGMLTSSGIIKEGVLFRVWLGYVYFVEDFGEWVAKEVNCTFPSTEDQTLTIKGQSRMISFAQNENSESFVGATDKQIAALIAMRNNLKLDADSAGITHEEIARSSMSEAEFLKTRAKALGYEYYVDDDVLHFHRYRYNELPFVLKYRSEFPGESNIIECSIKTKTMKKQRHANTKGVDTKKGKPIKEDITDAPTPVDEWEKQALGRRINNGLESLRTETLTGGLTAESLRFNDDDEVPEIIKILSAAQTAAERWTVELDVKTIGNPLIRRGKTVMIKGIGSRYDGPYYITESRHLLSDTGYQSSLLGKSTLVGKGKAPQKPTNTGIKILYNPKNRKFEFE